MGQLVFYSHPPEYSAEFMVFYNGWISRIRSEFPAFSAYFPTFNNILSDTVNIKYYLYIKDKLYVTENVCH